MGRPGRPRKKPLQDEDNGKFVALGVVQSDEEMDERNVAISTGKYFSKMYSKEGVMENVKAIVASIGSDVVNVGQKIHLSDTEAVEETTKRYILSCCRVGLLPSKMGLARACGMSVTALSNFIAMHPYHATTDYLQIVFDSFAEMRETAALNGAAHPIVSIFGLKANYGYRENEPVKEAREDPLGEMEDTDSIAKKYLELQG